MRTLLSILLTSGALLAQAPPKEDAWKKVCQLKTGTELRLFLKGSAQPVVAAMDEANDERLIAIVKDTQKAIAKEDIDRIDFRPLSKGSRMTRETRSTTSDTTREGTDTRPGSRPGPTGSTSTGISFGSKAPFETIYRRPPTPVRR